MLLTIAATVPNEERLQLIKDSGFDGVDYGFDDDQGLALNDDFIEYAKNTKKTLDKIGLVCHQTHATYLVKYGEEYNESNPNYLKTVRSILATPYLGASAVIVHPLNVPIGVDLMAENIKFYKTLEPYAKKAGVKIAVENLYQWVVGTRIHEGYMHTPEEMNELLDNLSDDFVCNFDTGHAAVVGIDPEDYIHAMSKERLKYLHVHDTDYTFDRHVIPFMLDHHWDKICEALVDIGYEGTMNLEVGSFMRRCGEGTEKLSYKIAEQSGRRLIKMIEEKRGKK